MENQAMTIIVSILFSIYLICQIVLCVKICRICTMCEKLAIPWDKIEAISNAWKSQQTPSHWAGTDTTASRQVKAPSLVEELPPEVIAPSLKKMQRSAGFGTNISDKNSDS